MPRMRYTINNMPLRSGLTTAGQQGTVPENSLWLAQNCMSGLDGVISKRPGLWQWGQTIKQPVGTDSLTAYETFEDLSHWSVSADDDSKVGALATDNQLRAYVNPSIAIPPTTTDLNVGLVKFGTLADSDDSDWSLRFVLRTTNMPADGVFEVGVTAISANTPYWFRFTQQGVHYYAGGPWIRIGSLDQTVVGSVAIEIRFDADGDVTVLADDVVLGTAPVSLMTAGPAFTAGDYVEFSFHSDTDLSSAYNVSITDLMLDGAAADAFTPKVVRSGTDFKYVVSNVAVKRTLFASTDTHVYYDPHLQRAWRPLMAVTGGNVSFAPYRDDLIIFDGDSAFGSTVYRYTGLDAPTVLDDAPPVRFGTEHRTRLFAAGDKAHPLRLYYTASNDPKTWFAPDSDADGVETEDEALDAGYLLIPGKRGDEILAVAGEFYGDCIAITNRGAWRVTGASPLSFAVESVSLDTGGSSPEGVTRLGNDLWYVGRQGVSSLQTVQQYGDMQAAMPSGKIADLWAPGVSNSSIKVDQYLLYKASMAWNPTLSLMLLAFVRQGATDTATIMAYNPIAQSWYGPWDSDASFVADVEIAHPVTQATMVGTTIGKIGILNTNFKADFDESYTMTAGSPYLCGRSLDPKLSHQVKTWKTLRVFLAIRGEWDLNIKWQVDDETYTERVEGQNLFNLPVLGTDFRLNVDPDGRMHSNQLIGVLEIPLDVRGRYFKFEIATDDAIVGEDLVLQGYEVEFLADGPDQEKE